jgi:hypothetical protein
VPYCTIVEFEWNETTSRELFATMLRTIEHSAPPAGCLSRIVGIDDSGARTIEVWRSSEDARAFAEASAPALAQTQLPPPTRVVGFEVTSYIVA